MNMHSLIEPLEARIAPAALLVSPTTASYMDDDGDRVMVKFSKPILTPLNYNAVIKTTPDGTGDRLATIDLVSLLGPASPFAINGPGLNITVTVTPDPNSGDTLTNIGWIRAAGINLGYVEIPGDLSRIDAGNGSATAYAVKCLSVNSLGAIGSYEAPNSPDLHSHINGPLGALKVDSDIINAWIEVTGGARGSIGSIDVYGGLLGTRGQAHDGSITATGDIGPVKLGGSIVGGAGEGSGLIASGGSLGGISKRRLSPIIIGGSVLGGNGADFSGQLVGVAGMGAVKIGGDLRGGSAGDSGKIYSHGSIASVTIGGSIIGGSGDQTIDPTAVGQIRADLRLGPVSVGRDILGGSGEWSGTVAGLGSVAAVKIGGSLIGGVGGATGWVYSPGDIGAVSVAGDVIGGSEDGSGAIVSTAGKIAQATIGGSILGGEGTQSGGVFAGAKLGKVSVGRDLKGGSGYFSGQISGSAIREVSVGGHVQGGGGEQSGAIVSTVGDVLNVAITGSLSGGTGERSGQIFAKGALGRVQIGGDLKGGSESHSGLVSGKSIMEVTIGGDLAGGKNSGEIDLTESGGIRSRDGSIDEIFIGGSILASQSTGAGHYSESAFIRSAEAIMSLTVEGSIVGGRTPVVISAIGDLNKLSVSGRVEGTNILAGYDGSVPFGNGPRIGTVLVGGNWIASNLVAGAVNVGSVPNVNFGDSYDRSVVAPGQVVHSVIKSVSIGGQIHGTADPYDHFGFVAQEIVSFKVGTFKLRLRPGPDNDTTPRPIGASGDVTIHEV